MPETCPAPFSMSSPVPLPAWYIDDHDHEMMMMTNMKKANDPESCGTRPNPIQSKERNPSLSIHCRIRPIVVPLFLHMVVTLCHPHASLQPIVHNLHNATSTMPCFFPSPSPIVSQSVCREVVCACLQVSSSSLKAQFQPKTPCGFLYKGPIPVGIIVNEECHVKKRKYNRKCPLLKPQKGPREIRSE